MFVFHNVPAQRIRGFLHRDAALHVFFFSSSTHQPTDVKCIDVEKVKELLAVGIGGWVKLYNVKATIRNGILVTASSGIRPVRDNSALNESGFNNNNNISVHENGTKDSLDDTTVMGSRQRITNPRSDKWLCLICNWPNFNSTTVCRSCKMARKQGPEGPASLFNHLKGPPYTHDTWTCASCFARKNSHWKDECWKCDKDRPRKPKKRKAKVINSFT